MINNREQALNKLNELDIDELLTSEDNSDQKAQYLSILNELKEYLSSNLSLADFLGWNEDQIYEKDDHRYQIRNNKLYRTSLEIENWRLLLDVKLITELQNATKVARAFYLQLPILGNGENYLNYDISNNYIMFATSRETTAFKTIFTEEDIKELEEKFNTDLSYLKRIPVED